MRRGCPRNQQIQLCETLELTGRFCRRANRGTAQFLLPGRLSCRALRQATSTPPKRLTLMRCRPQCEQQLTAAQQQTLWSAGICCQRLLNFHALIFCLIKTSFDVNYDSLPSNHRETLIVSIAAPVTLHQFVFEKVWFCFDFAKPEMLTWGRHF